VIKNNPFLTKATDTNETKTKQYLLTGDGLLSGCFECFCTQLATSICSALFYVTSSKENIFAPLFEI
jgi:hypothetical protein